MMETPLTIGHLQLWMIRTGSRWKGRDKAREALAELVTLGMIEDTGRVEKPRTQHDLSKLKWWRIYRILPFQRISSYNHAYAAKGSVPPLIGSLCLFLGCQVPGTTRKKARDASEGSVQMAFAACGPP